MDWFRLDRHHTRRLEAQPTGAFREALVEGKHVGGFPARRQVQRIGEIQSLPVMGERLLHHRDVLDEQLRQAEQVIQRRSNLLPPAPA